MNRRCDGPHVRLYQAGSITLLPLAEWKLLNAAIDGEHEWFATRTLHGARLRIRVASITDIAEMTQDVLDALEADEPDEEEDGKWRPS